MTSLCASLDTPVSTLDAQLQELWDILNDAAVITSCRNINGLYQAAVYDDLCNSLPEGLRALWVSCVFLTILLIVLVSWLLKLSASKVLSASVDCYKTGIDFYSVLDGP